MPRSRSASPKRTNDEAPATLAIEGVPEEVASLVASITPLGDYGCGICYKKSCKGECSSSPQIGEEL
jgi:hypothetical protein